MTRDRLTPPSGLKMDQPIWLLHEPPYGQSVSSQEMGMQENHVFRTTENPIGLLTFVKSNAKHNTSTVLRLKSSMLAASSCYSSLDLKGLVAVVPMINSPISTLVVCRLISSQSIFFFKESQTHSPRSY